jgi:hypothetical protein
VPRCTPTCLRHDAAAVDLSKPRGARETARCAWVAQHAPGNPKALTEFERRVASLRDGDETVRWSPF